MGTEQVEAGRARLRKYVVTEQQTVQVPVSREEVRVEREPITDANRGDALSGAGHHRGGTRGRAARGTARRARPRPSRWNGSGSAPKPSPSSKPSPVRSARNRSSSTTPPARAGRLAPVRSADGPQAQPGPAVWRSTPSGRRVPATSEDLTGVRQRNPGGRRGRSTEGMVRYRVRGHADRPGDRARRTDSTPRQRSAPSWTSIPVPNRWIAAP